MNESRIESEETSYSKRELDFLFFLFTENCFPVNKKTLRRDAHCGVQSRCRKRPPLARECVLTHSITEKYL